MSTTTERMGIYGFTHGLGYRGGPKEMERLLRSLWRAVDRGDWDRVFRLVAAYGAGAWVGSWVRQKIDPAPYPSETGAR